MTKAIPAVLVLALACLLALSAALPSVLDQDVSLQTDPNAPRTFLGKPYRRRRDVQGCSRPCCTLVIADRNDSHTDPDPDVSTHQQTEPITCPFEQWRSDQNEDGYGAARQACTFACCQFVSRVWIGAFTFADGPGLGDVPLSSEPRVVSKSQGTRQVAFAVGRWKRLYDRGEWKSRLLEEY
ncbi:hypothetical protein JVT61DRAFT_2669 [Boletus reticuloceps]|uniref:Secreted protein n=1 Tax=Boletus reticuloceps TaxID=495285 RepID=A0A8I2YQY7_9AGAM|nr:hypothetical protein JVT61DRAFT_2669 [Boletus reticuloceps]